MHSHSMAKLIFFHLFGENLIFRKRLGVATYFCFIFFKMENKIRKKNPKCDSLFGKVGLWKTESGFEGPVIYRESTVKTVAPL